jgi:phage gpG-like protein
MEIYGEDELEKKLSEDTIKVPISENIKKAAAWLLAQVQMSEPVGRSSKGSVGGRLRSSVTQKVSEDQFIIGTNVEYSPFVEYGHKQQVGRFVPVLGKRLVEPFVSPSRVRIGSDERVRDMGAFTYGLKEARDHISEWLKEISLAIKTRFA